MKEVRLMWDMPITVEIADKKAGVKDAGEVFEFFHRVDRIFSTFREDSEISRINKKIISKKDYSPEMKEVLDGCEKTKKETGGYFEIKRGEMIDPTGLVKGWAVNKGAQLLRKKGFADFYIDAGGDIQADGQKDGRPWIIGIRNPFNRRENVKIVALTDRGIATSGTYIRGQHIYDPVNGREITDPVSLTVIAENIYEADRFATAAFAMGIDGIKFIAGIKNLDAYSIDSKGIATYTPGFTKFII